MRRPPAWPLLPLLLLTGVACDRPAGAGGPGRGKPPGDAPVTVAVEAVAQERVEQALIGYAPLEPEVEVDVPARAEGTVLEVLAEVGDPVAAGQVIARLDDTRARLQLREAELALAQAETARARAEKLAGQGLSSTEEVEQTRQAVVQAELTLERARLDAADLRLLSPIDGVVVERLLDRGDEATRGSVAFRVADRDPLLARVRVPETQAELLQVGQPARIEVEAHPGPLRGEVIRVAPLVDVTSGTVVATVAVREAADAVRINRFATVRIVVAERPEALTVPQAALALRGDEDRVWVFEPEQGELGRLRLRRVRLGVQQGERVEVLEGLRPGELVVTAAPDDVRDGTLARRPPGAPGGLAAVDTASR